MNDTSLRRAGMILIATTVLARMVGFLREAVIASTYGTTHTVDVYLAAMTLPAIVATIVFHSIPNAFVPLFSGNSGHGQARRQAWGLLGVMCVLSAGIWLLAEPLATITNSGFPALLKSETVVILRITTIAIVLATIEALTRSRLLARRQFVRPGLSLLWQSAVMVVAVWLFPEGGARTLAWGFVAGGATAAIWNSIPMHWFRKTRPPGLETAQPVAEPLHTNIGLWVPIILLADTIPQLFAVIDRHLASFLTEGSIAALQYANLIVVIPVSICGITLGMAILPFLSSAILARETDRASDILDKAVRWSLIVVVPFTVWVLFFSQEITSLLYERGAFGPQSRMLTASTLKVFAIGMIPNVLLAILAKVFYSSRRWRPVMAASVLSVAAKWVLSVWLVEEHGTIGLAAAAAAGTFAGAAVFVFALPSEFLRDRWSRWVGLVLAMAATCVTGSLVAIGVVTAISIESHMVMVITRIALGVLFSGAITLWMAKRLRINELVDAWALLTRIGSRT